MRHVSFGPLPSAAYYGYYISLYTPVAISYSFLPLWIKAHGLTEQQFGILFSLGALLKLVVNPVVGWAADVRWGRKCVLLTLLCGSTLTTMILASCNSWMWVFAAYVLVQIFSTSLLPLSESIVFSNATTLKLDFGRLRSVGSITVAVATLSLGAFFEWTSLNYVALVLAFSFLIQTIFAARLQDSSRACTKFPTRTLREVLRIPGFPAFLCSAGVSQSCHGLYYTYSAVLMATLGYSPVEIGALWSLGVIAEVIVFILGSKILSHVSAPVLILFACTGGLIRWALLSDADHITTLILVQLLQAATLGCTQLAAAHFIKAAVPAHAMSSATGIYAGVVGVLMAVLIYVGSDLYAIVGGKVFLLSAVLCLAAGSAGTLLLRTRIALPRNE